MALWNESSEHRDHPIGKAIYELHIINEVAIMKMENFDNIYDLLVSRGFRVISYGNCVMFIGKQLGFIYFGGKNMKVCRIQRNGYGLDFVDLVTGQPDYKQTT